MNFNPTLGSGQAGHGPRKKHQVFSNLAQHMIRSNPKQTAAYIMIEHVTGST
jgi:hypothetical protein